ncbi:hypothetical protein PHMEG_00019515 [Phytophthora megakarya]|uniref:Uncharacterized protein n=1 Tax=Phytophthora megakarya TaxID=4795 RepID=A0A225VSL8_9STRA|nr:hypothetical protein PHMEG_00019515 [Phytophthora megakarya]
MSALKKDSGFKEKHASKYGLKVSACAAHSIKVTSVMCQFCSRFGRELAVYGNLPRVPKCFKYSRKNFTPLTVKVSMGRVSGATYRGAANSLFAPTPSTQQTSLHTHFESTKPLFFELNKSIVEAIVGDLLFHPDDIDGILHERSLAIFQGVGRDGEAEGYVAKVQNHRKFSLLMKLIACASSFRQAMLQMECAKVETGIGDYGGCSDIIAANYTYTFTQLS